MKKIIVFVLISTVLFSCKDKKKEISPSAPTVENKIVAKEITIEETNLKNVVVDTTYFAEKVKICKGISKKEVQKLHLEKQTPDFENYRNTVKVLDTLLQNSKTKILLVAIDEENESSVLLVQYDAKNDLVDSELVFYQDVVEYLSWTSAVINANEIIITTENDNGENLSTEIEKYFFRNNKFIKK